MTVTDQHSDRLINSAQRLKDATTEKQRSAGKKRQTGKASHAGGLILGLVVGVLVGIGGLLTVQHFTAPTPVDASVVELEKRGFENARAIDEQTDAYWASVEGYNSQCVFRFTRDTTDGEWTLTRQASSAGEGDFTLKNPNAAQLATNHPEQLAGCEVVTGG